MTAIDQLILGMFVKWWNTFSILIFFPVRFLTDKQVRLSLASEKHRVPS